MTAGFPVKSAVVAVILLSATSTAGHAQQIINLTPSPSPAAATHYAKGAQIFIEGGTSPTAVMVTIKGSWLAGQSTVYWKVGAPPGTFTTRAPSMPTTSSITAPTIAGSYSIIVKAFKPNDPNETDMKVIDIVVDP